MENQKKTYLQFFIEGKGNEIPHFALPKELVKNKKYSILSSEAKLMYSMMLEKFFLPEENKLIDSNGDKYINYLLKDIQCDFNTSKKKVLRDLKKLETVGLIHVERMKGNEPNKIYVFDCYGNKLGKGE